jgi:4-hydroxy-3-methylbut-2-enyl diphosphate reductase
MSLVREAKDQGFRIVVVGDKNHPEVIGINGWCDNEASVVTNLEEAKRVTEDHLFIVAQTNNNLGAVRGDRFLF